MKTDAESTPAASQTSAPLGVWDAGSLIVGIVIGASLFAVPADVFSNVPTAGTGLLLWLAGGLLSLTGALCYCELATAYPRMGGDYVYLTRAYGPGTGFVFGWMRLTVIVPANIGAMAFVFAEHAGRLFDISGSTALLAAGAIVVLTAVNLVGGRSGTRVQNMLTVLKLIGLALIVMAGAWLAFGNEPPAAAPTPETPRGVNYGLALVFILYAYGGWSDAAFVAAEVRDVRRNIPRALLAGLGMITAIYLAVNLAYVAGLGLEGVRGSKTPAAELLERAGGPVGEAGIGIIVMISTLAAINGMLYSGARLTASLGAEHRILKLLGKWDPLRGAPVRALLAIGGLSLLLVWLCGTPGGKSVLDACVTWTGERATNWKPGDGGFHTLVTGTAPTFWVFFCLTAAAVPLLRWREPQVERPFRCGVAVTPLVFCATSVYMLWSSVLYAWELALLGVVVLLAGVVAYAISVRLPRDSG
ncbi:MAG: amino acid permease [Planctomycetaceae bacterium]|nr:amino acid permease [Planctomycetaceae bacterium]